MTPGGLGLHLEAYLALQRALGFPLGAREKLLRDFVAFVEKNGFSGSIPAQVALDWACSASERCGLSGKAARLTVARRFLLHLSALAPGHAAGASPPAQAVFVLSRRTQPPAPGRLSLGAARVAATAHAFNLIGADGQLRPARQ
jgi:hypothetical protein